jgi:hypothetical protein
MENSLIKQLEDKKKELNSIDKRLTNLYKQNRLKQYAELFNKYAIRKAEIAILEQAIAEIEKQRQNFIDIINSLGEIRGKSNDLQCIKLGESFSTNSVEWLKKELLKQINQPNSERKE